MIFGNIEVLPTIEEVSIFVNQKQSVNTILSADDVCKQHLEAEKYILNNEIILA